MATKRKVTSRKKKVDKVETIVMKEPEIAISKDQEKIIPVHVLVEETPKPITSAIIPGTGIKRDFSQEQPAIIPIAIIPEKRPIVAGLDESHKNAIAPKKIPQPAAPAIPQIRPKMISTKDINLNAKRKAMGWK